MGYFSSMKNKSPEQAAKFRATLEKGIPKPKSFIDSSGGGHKHMKLGKDGKYHEAKIKKMAAKSLKTKSGMRHKGQKYDMHSSDYVGERKPARKEIKKKWEGIVGKH